MNVERLCCPSCLRRLSLHWRGIYNRGHGRHAERRMWNNIRPRFHYRSGKRVSQHVPLHSGTRAGHASGYHELHDREVGDVRRADIERGRDHQFEVRPVGLAIQRQVGWQGQPDALRDTRLGLWRLLPEAGLERALAVHDGHDKRKRGVNILGAEVLGT